MHIETMIGSANFNDPSIQGQVNGTVAKRSPGSALKPFVYALALDAGLIHPMTMLKGLPKKYAGFTLENFGRGFVEPFSAQDV
jgi:penicillin-binding protein 1C